MSDQRFSHACIRQPRAFVGNNCCPPTPRNAPHTDRCLSTSLPSFCPCQQPCTVLRLSRLKGKCRCEMSCRSMTAFRNLTGSMGSSFTQLLSPKLFQPHKRHQSHGSIPDACLICLLQKQAVGSACLGSCWGSLSLPTVKLVVRREERDQKGATRAAG